MFISSHLPHYFSFRINREVREIYWHTAIYNLALAIVYIFEPIYLYKLGYSLADILAFFCEIYVAYAILVFLGAKIASKIGYKHSILISSVFYICYWLTLVGIAKIGWLFYLSPVMFALQKSFFWPAYHADIAINSLHQQRGREVGVLFSLIELAMIAGPLIGGLVSYIFGFWILFATGSILLLSSLIPLFRSADIHNHHEFRLKDFLLVLKRHKTNFFGYWGYAEDLMLGTLWPVYIFLVVPYFVLVGAVTTVASLVGSVLMLYLGKLADKIKRTLLIKISSVFYGFTWMFRFLAATPPLVVVFDVLTRIGKGMVNIPMVSLTYDLAGSRTTDYAIAYSVFYEFSLSIAKIFTTLVGIWILTKTGNVQYVFILAGVLTMFYGFLKDKKK
ncbi:MAG: hypothetical protein A3B10_03500 [Candidatus Doudnabacteria bacterium RIFCSPLOWO2_01_FULL_44_21]|uniref:Major facilitator superfamily (MFS) profile domain-containing protein n=1 Tax=Candidatus Doudnabacteria bacterium RIFCSPLOWO2_01_FULL_44_21 TaxID=1817841 RepID=A0A1F5PY11_9BACT|nr:MAG: hypothetical protein A3B95_02345 [Candidatus Doudnabacteria bacterium RIFCSPHIGHO2_02_FULL_43_13b]OGE94828.1 MAG: hypothetical protein A3B10_03500 [Candidatus Doudnabacteria bacterium RIFCSPLOWO2_01_FULL_44_21]